MNERELERQKAINELLELQKKEDHAGFLKKYLELMEKFPDFNEGPVIKNLVIPKNPPAFIEKKADHKKKSFIKKLFRKILNFFRTKKKKQKK